MFKQNILKYLCKIEKPQECALTAENGSAIINQRSPKSEKAFRYNRKQAFFRKYARIELSLPAAMEVKDSNYTNCNLWSTIRITLYCAM